MEDIIVNETSDTTLLELLHTLDEVSARLTSFAHSREDAERLREQLQTLLERLNEWQ